MKDELSDESDGGLCDGLRSQHPNPYCPFKEGLTATASGCAVRTSGIISAAESCSVPHNHCLIWGQAGWAISAQYKLTPPGHFGTKAPLVSTWSPDLHCTLTFPHKQSCLVFIPTTNIKVKVKVKSLSCVRLLATPWTAAHQAPPSMGFSRQEYWSGVPLPSPQISRAPLISSLHTKPSLRMRLLGSPAWHMEWLIHMVSPRCFSLLPLRFWDGKEYDEEEINAGGGGVKKK